MKIDDALAAFEQNVSMLNPQTDPIQWNLNRGLANLCEAVKQLQIQQRRQATQLDEIQSKLRQLR